MSRVCDETFLVFGTFVVSPGEAKKRGILGTKVFFCFETRGEKTEFECKITFLWWDDRNGQKHTHTYES